MLNIIYIYDMYIYIYILNIIYYILYMTYYTVYIIGYYTLPHGLNNLRDPSTFKVVCSWIKGCCALWSGPRAKTVYSKPQFRRCCSQGVYMWRPWKLDEFRKLCAYSSLHTCTSTVQAAFMPFLSNAYIPGIRNPKFLHPIHSQLPATLPPLRAQCKDTWCSW